MNISYLQKFIIVGGMALSLWGCAEVSVPDARNVNIPTPVTAEKRRAAVNERPDSVTYLPLGEDVLVPERMSGERMPKEIVGPFELRGETLAGALQLILADYDISIAFETDAGLTKKVTVANLKGPLDKVVERVCSLADLYCSYEDGALVVKDTQTFTVSLPPLGTEEAAEEFIDDVITGLTAVIGENGRTPVSDPTTRTIIYGASQRTAKLAENYFERLRANTAMIVFETYIWEVSLNAGNSTGIDWDAMRSFGKFNTNIAINGSIAADFTNPVSIGLPTTAAIGASPTQLIEFLSQFGAVKAISQPQITVLSGASAALRVADTQNYVSEVTSTSNANTTSTSVSTDSVDSGFTLTIGSSWDKSTVYANVNINITNVDQIEDFTFSDGGAAGTDTIIQLPQTTERELTTQIRVRPGDSVLIAGLVRERDNFNSRGPGFMEPVIPDSRTAKTDNLELVIMLRPRVIVYTAADNPNFIKYAHNKAEALLQNAIATHQDTNINVPPLPIEPTYSEPKKYSEEINSGEDVVSPFAVESMPVESAPIPLVREVQPAYVAPAYVPPVYEKTVEPAYIPPSIPPSMPQAPLEPVATPKVSSYNNYGGYENNSSDYVPPKTSGYVPVYESGAAPRVYGSAPSYPAPTPAPVYPSSTYAAPQPTRAPSRSPMSADVYNNAQPLNVYEIYEQSKGN